MATTGRLFRCLSISGLQSKQVRAWYEVGKIYRECDYDILEENFTTEDTLLMYTDIEMPMLDEKGDIFMFSPMFYVSAMDFELIPIIKSISLN